MIASISEHFLPHLQMSLQMQHILLNYFKYLSVTFKTLSADQIV